MIQGLRNKGFPRFDTGRPFTRHSAQRGSIRLLQGIRKSYGTGTNRQGAHAPVRQSHCPRTGHAARAGVGRRTHWQSGQVSADNVFTLMRQISRSGTAFLIVTHDPRLAARCDRVIELVDGKVQRDEAVVAAKIST